MSTRVAILFYSMYGHVYQLAEAIGEGVRKVEGCDVQLLQVPEQVPDEALVESGAMQARAAFAHIPTADVSALASADALIFGTPTRFRNMGCQVRSFLDRTTQLWLSGGLIGKVGSVFVSTASQHGGQETTIQSFHTRLLHHGMIVVGVPYSEARLVNMDAISGGSPYGATTLSGAEGPRQPSENELAIARFQGKHVAQIAHRLRRA